MTISSSLNAGVAGLNANATRLGTIADNISNSSTYGYKRATTDFHSMVIASQGATYSAGGVRTTTQRIIDERGSLVSTSNPTDLAVRGRGMIPVALASEVEGANGAPQMYLSSTGSFRTDADGYLKSPSGMVLMGWPALPDGTIPTYPRDTQDALEPVRLNVNQFTGEPTTAIDVAVNLPATETESDGSGDMQQLSIEYFDNLGTSENVKLQFEPTLPANPGDPATNEWTLTIRDTALNDAIIGNYTLYFDDSRTSGGTLLDPGGVVTNALGGGGVYDPSTGSMIVQVAGGPLEINIGRLGSSEGLTQLSDSFAPVSISKDGTPVGNMTSVEVDANGYVYAYFDTGITRTIYQIPLVDVPNPNGMVSLDNQTYLPSPESGSFFLWNAGDGPTGDIVAFAREESATDVAAELTTMIQTQRAYSTNAKVIQTVDEMLQETTNIKR